jgi:rubredoxin
MIGNFGFKSSAEFDKFDGVNIHTTKSGLPVVTDATVAWFDCKVTNSFDLGTHYLIIGQVIEAELIADEEPLTYQTYREKYKMFSPKNSPTYLEQKVTEENHQNKDESGQTTEPPHEHIFDGKSYICVICGFVYNPEEGDPSMGIQPGTPFEELPENYKCPICNAGKDYFKEL